MTDMYFSTPASREIHDERPGSGAAGVSDPDPGQSARPSGGSPDPVRALIAEWEMQQDAYVAKRAERFGIVLDAIQYAKPGVTTILDAAGGLGSFSRLILERFPEVRVVTLDYDPALLALARRNLAEFGERSLVVEANLLDPSWPAALEGWLPEVVVSSTALHWLPAGGLVSFYERLARVLPEGALFFNADHLSLGVEGSFFRAVSAADDARQQAAFEDGVLDWDGWWERFSEGGEFDELIAERDARFAAIWEDEARDVSPVFHAESLRVAGFREAGTLWQYFDDYVVYARR
ncbi:class I SAM-dependent methyltransferase [Leucobacter luti]|uniref:class I SAM-dependent methyltransferase n=1 Tax=Leucobacter luti TaxID=340320 RepID=UPI003D06EC70